MIRHVRGTIRLVWMITFLVVAAIIWVGGSSVAALVGSSVIFLYAYLIRRDLRD
jgi:hypothetical protein